MAHIEPFEKERMQASWEHLVEYDISLPGVSSVSIQELVGIAERPEEALTLLSVPLDYARAEGSEETRERIASWYPGADVDNVTISSGGSEANHLILWTLLEPGDRLAFMVPNHMQGWGLGRHLGEGTDTFRLRRGVARWELDAEGLERAVTERTKVVMVCNPNNPTGGVLTDEEMSAIVRAADRVGAWIVADEIYRGAEVDSDEASPTFWDRYERVVVTSGLSKAFALPGLRAGWMVAPTHLLSDVWMHRDYTTLMPGFIADRLAGVAMEPATRERLLARTRGIIRTNLPAIEGWIADQGDLLTYLRPIAGAIAYVEYDLAIEADRLLDEVRREARVLLVPGRMFGLLGNGFRIGFGYELDATMKGLELVAAVLAGIGSRR